MIKKITKVTSLLITMASIVSIVPVQAAEYQKLDSKPGTINNANAKGNGIFINGTVNGGKKGAYWISDDGKHNKLEGLSSQASLKDLIYNKYLEIDNGLDAYFDKYSYIDITNDYKMADNTIREDLEDDQAILLRKNIKNDNDGRFDENFYTASSIIDATVEDTNKFLNSSNGLAIYNYKLKKSKISGDEYSTIYTDSKGNYIDADYNIGKLEVSTSTTGSSVTIENTEDTYELKQDNKTYILRAEIKQNKYITEVSDYIYRFADLTIYKKEKGADDSTYTPVTSELKFGKNSYTVTNRDSVTVLQKFTLSSASDDIDGIKYPKDSKIYFIADEDGNSEYLLGKSAQDSVMKVKAALGGINKITGNAQGLYSMYLDSKNRKIYVEKFTLKSKKGFNYLDIEAYESSDSESIRGINTSDGMPWGIDSGYIKTWDGKNGFTKLYRLDGSITNLSLSSKDNMIAWNKGTEVYSIIDNFIPDKSVTAATTSSTTSAAVTMSKTNTNGWVLNKDNTWNYILEDGTKKTVWIKSNDIWHYLKPDGIMATGWINDNNTWYYLNKSGAMAANTVVAGYKLGSNGAWINS